MDKISKQLSADVYLWNLVDCHSLLVDAETLVQVEPTDTKPWQTSQMSDIDIKQLLIFRLSDN